MERKQRKAFWEHTEGAFIQTWVGALAQAKYSSRSILDKTLLGLGHRLNERVGRWVMDGHDGQKEDNVLIVSSLWGNSCVSLGNPKEV
jgi:hypothetical protein